MFTKIDGFFKRTLTGVIKKVYNPLSDDDKKFFATMIPVLTLCVVEFTEMPLDKLLHDRFYKGLRLQSSV